MSRKTTAVYERRIPFFYTYYLGMLIFFPVVFSVIYFFARNLGINASYRLGFYMYFFIFFLRLLDPIKVVFRIENSHLIFGNYYIFGIHFSPKVPLSSIERIRFVDNYARWSRLGIFFDIKQKDRPYGGLLPNRRYVLRRDYWSDVQGAELKRWIQIHL